MREEGENRGRRLDVFAMVAVFVVAGVVFALRGPSPTSLPAQAISPSTSTPTSVSPSTATVPTGSLLRPSIVGLDGTIRLELPKIPQDARSLDLSTDGRQVAFLTWTVRHLNGFCGACLYHSRLAMIGTDGTEGRFLEFTGPGDLEGMPAWSPDGSRIAFVTDHRIYVIDADGGNLRRLTRGGGGEFPAWSPDGTTIVYDSARATPLDGSGLSPTQEIWSVPVDGGRPTRLTHNHVPDQAPTYSPDGSRIAFIEDGRIVLMHATGGVVRSLPGNPHGWTPRWSPDGRSIAFLTFNGTRATVPDPNGGRKATISLPLGSVEVVDVATGHVTDVGVQTASAYNAVSWTPDSRALLVSRYVPATGAGG